MLTSVSNVHEPVRYEQIAYDQPWQDIMNKELSALELKQNLGCSRIT